MKAAGADAATKHAWAWAWGLTDEVFGASLGELARGRRFSEAFMFGIGLAAYASWIAGTIAGALAGGGALEGWPVVEAGLGFMLTALFLALLLSILTRSQVPVIVVAAVATVVGTLALSSTAGILGGMVAGAVAGACCGNERRCSDLGPDRGGGELAVPLWTDEGGIWRKGRKRLAGAVSGGHGACGDCHAGGGIGAAGAGGRDGGRGAADRRGCGGGWAVAVAAVGGGGDAGGIAGLCGGL